MELIIFLFLILSNKLTLVYDNDVCFIFADCLVSLTVCSAYFQARVVLACPFLMAYGPKMCLFIQLFTQFFQEKYTECLLFTNTILGIRINRVLNKTYKVLAFVQITCWWEGKK